MQKAKRSVRRMQFLPICVGCEILVNMADWKHAFNLISFRT